MIESILQKEMEMELRESDAEKNAADQTIFKSFVNVLKMYWFRLMFYCSKMNPKHKLKSI